MMSLGPLYHPVSKLFVPKGKLNIGKYAFCVAVPTIGNQLPITFRSETIATYRKTCMFKIAFPL